MILVVFSRHIISTCQIILKHYRTARRLYIFSMNHGHDHIVLIQTVKCRSIRTVQGNIRTRGGIHTITAGPFQTESVGMSDPYLRTFSLCRITTVMNLATIFPGRIHGHLFQLKRIGITIGYGAPLMRPCKTDRCRSCRLDGNRLIYPLTQRHIHQIPLIQDKPGRLRHRQAEIPLYTLTAFVVEMQGVNSRFSRSHTIHCQRCGCTSIYAHRIVPHRHSVQIPAHTVHMLRGKDIRLQFQIRTFTILSFGIDYIAFHIDPSQGDRRFVMHRYIPGSTYYRRQTIRIIHMAGIQTGILHPHHFL